MSGANGLISNGVCAIIPEFHPQALDSLRQPLESGEVMVARANYHIRYPAKVQLVAAQNPCRCGVGGPGRGHCGKAPRCQMAYQSRVSGPLLDRIDLTVDVPPVTAADLALPPPAEGTAEVAARIAEARRIQTERADKHGDGVSGLNARAEGGWLETIAALDAPASALLARAAEAGGLSARGWTRTIRLARTIADLEGAGAVRRVHIAEAQIYRRIAPAAENLGENRASAYGL
jgi:magnesium chelatase family protein